MATRMTSTPMVRSVGRVAVGAMVANACSYLVHVPAGRWLDPAGYGEFAVLLQMILLLSVPAAALQAVTAREVVRGRDSATLLRTGGLTVFAVCVVAAGAVPAVVALCGTGVAATIAAAVSAPLLVVVAIAQGIYQGREQFGRLSVIVGAVGVVRAVPAVAGLLVTHSATGAFVGFAVGAVVAVAMVLPGGLPGLRSRADHPVAGVPHGPGAVVRASQVQLVLIVLTSVDLLLARRVLGDHDAGIYAIGAIATKVAFWLPQAVGVVFFPRMADLDRSRLAQRSALLVVGALGAFVVVAAAVSSPLIPLVFGGEYRSVSGWLWLFAITGAAQAVVQVVLLAAIAVERTVVSGWVWACVAAETCVALTFAHSVIQLAYLACATAAVSAAGGVLWISVTSSRDGSTVKE